MVQESLDSAVLTLIRNFTLQNAYLYGQPDPKAIMGKVMGGNKELRPLAQSVMRAIREESSRVSKLSMDDIQEELERNAPELLEKKEGTHTVGLPDLPGVDGEVVVRFAPGPSGPLHIGHSRAAILNDEYVKRYGGKYILRLEDTNPMKILESAYDLIQKDMEWLGTDIHEVVIQSDRFPLYEEYAGKIIEAGGGYVCTCPVEQWREFKERNQACPHRERPMDEQMGEWENMLSEEYGEGEASLIVKTDLDHPNPAIRDFVAMRILDHPHPRTGNAHRVYPLYNFSVAVDDHLLGMTHVLRGKDHLNNTFKQKYIYKYFGWKEPDFIHYGWVSIPDTLLKTSSIREGIDQGTYSGWDDVRLGTFRALEKRGFNPESIRRYWIEVGIKEVDITFSWKNLTAFNKEIINPISPRYFFVADPVPMTVTNVVELTGRAPFFPDRPNEGHRDVHLVSDGIGIRIVVTREDADLLEMDTVIRLKDLGNVRILKTGSKGIAAEYVGNDLSILKQGARNIHWCPQKGVKTTVHMPDGSTLKGLTEPGILECRFETVQFERFAFVRIEKTRDEGAEEGAHGIQAYFTHK